MKKRLLFISINLIFILNLIIYLLLDNKNYQDYKYVYHDFEVPVFTEKEIPKEEKVQDVFYGTITAYGPDCYGCIGITASGYDVTNNIYYEDDTYGTLRIVAADASIPFGTVIKITNDTINIKAIVLDRGSAIGFQTLSQMDLLYESEYKASFFGRQHNTMFEVLRYGY